MKRSILSSLLIFLLVTTSFGQACFTGGTGVDGAYSATFHTSIAGGTYNFTTFNIDPGVVVNVTGTQPLIIYCTGNATIYGNLTANGGNGADGVTYVSGGIGGIGVAGGANGGDGTFAVSTGPITAFAGSGPGGAGNQGDGWSGGGGAGYALTGSSSGGVGGFGGPIYGDANITLLESGSGGGGGSGGYDCGAGGGGAGGGVIVVQSAGSIVIGVAGMISTNGGSGGSDGTGNCGGGGGGSGGSIYLAAPSVTNDGVINSLAGLGGASTLIGSPYYGVGGNCSEGRIRVDHNGSILGSGTTNPPIGAENTINVAPTFVAVAFPNDSVCEGDSITLYGDGDAVSYAWSGGITDSVAFAPTGIMLYTVTATSVGGCTSTSSITITTNSLPIVSLGSDIVQANPPVTLDAGTGFNSYLWNDSSTTQTISATTNGTYIVTVSNANGCENSDTVQVTFTAGINNASGSQPIIQVYPNPSNGNLYLNIQDLQSNDIVLNIFDITGKMVYTQPSNPPSNNITKLLDLTELTNGVYILQINADGMISQHRFIISK